MANPELEWWEKQQNEKLNTTVREALARGVNAALEIEKAQRAYRRLKKLGLNRGLVEANVGSEVDAVTNWLQDEIRKTKPRTESN